MQRHIRTLFYLSFLHPEYQIFPHLRHRFSSISFDEVFKRSGTKTMLQIAPQQSPLSKETVNCWLTEFSHHIVRTTPPPYNQRLGE